MSTAAAIPARLRDVDPIAHPIAAVAAFLSLEVRDVYRAVKRFDLPHIRISQGRVRQGRVLVLEGDLQVLLGSSPDGPATIDAAFRGKWRVRLSTVAAAFGVCTRTLRREVRAGRFPAVRSGRGAPYYVLRERLVEWLRAHRVPARSEVA